MKTKFDRIGIKAIDRGGSNLILALFHYHNEFYSLNEKVITELNSVEEFLINRRFSVFGESDQGKDIFEVRNIVQKIPRETEEDGNGLFKYRYCDHQYDKTCLVIRNPFRVAISHTYHFYAPGTKVGNFSEWGLSTQEKFKNVVKSVVDWTSDAIAETNSDNITIFLENFVNNFEIELPKLIRWADSDAIPNPSRNIGKDYYHNIFEPAAAKWCRHHTPTSFSGGFQPLSDITITRLLQENIKLFYNDSECLEYCKAKLGNYLYDYWLYDVMHGYKDNLNLNLI